jgi:hypothetical protein
MCNHAGRTYTLSSNSRLGIYSSTRALHGVRGAPDRRAAKHKGGDQGLRHAVERERFGRFAGLLGRGLGEELAFGEHVCREVDVLGDACSDAGLRGVTTCGAAREDGQGEMRSSLTTAVGSLEVR